MDKRICSSAKAYCRSHIRLRRTQVRVSALGGLLRQKFFRSHFEEFFILWNFASGPAAYSLKISFILKLLNREGKEVSYSNF